jgi:FKBP12-rapamycin complex-associated protein
MMAESYAPEMDSKLGDDLISDMFQVGLSTSMVESLRAIGLHIPSRLENIQAQLFACIASILKNPEATSDDHGKFALSTLGSFDFHQHNLLTFLTDHVLKFLNNSQQDVRMEAACTLRMVLLRPHYESASFNKVISVVMRELLAAGLADPSPDVRLVVVQSLRPRFEFFLLRTVNLNSCFLFLNDDSFAIRLEAMSVMGRLAVQHPAYVLPALRLRLPQLGACFLNFMFYIFF